MFPTPDHASDADIAKLLEAPITNHEKLAELIAPLNAEVAAKYDSAITVRPTNAETLLGNRPFNLPQYVFDTAAAMNRAQAEQVRPLRDGDTNHTAAALYGKLKGGGATMRKVDAYDIGNELETLQRERDEALATVQRLLSEIAAIANGDRNG